MSIDYSLEFATSTSAAQVADELLRVAESVGVVVATQLLDGVRVRRGLWVRVLRPTVAPWQVVVTDLGISPTVRVAFRLNKFDDLGAQQDDIVLVTLGLLDVVAGDAVLQRELETVWLLRRGGELTLHERDDLWTPKRLAMVGARPHSRRTWSFAD